MSDVESIAKSTPEVEPARVLRRLIERGQAELNAALALMELDKDRLAGALYWSAVYACQALRRELEDAEAAVAQCIALAAGRPETPRPAPAGPTAPAPADDPEARALALVATWPAHVRNLLRASDDCSACFGDDLRGCITALFTELHNAGAPVDVLARAAALVAPHVPAGAEGGAV